MATVLTPSFLHVRITLIAISPRLAIKILSNGFSCLTAAAKVRLMGLRLVTDKALRRLSILD